jgi:uncharacterized protein (DUF305 family)
MSPYPFMSAAILGTLIVPVALAQGDSRSAIKLPAACGEASQMQGQGSSNPKDMSKLTETQKGLHKAMKDMEAPMMAGAMAKDADVAWICAMIPHHQGAIDMAHAGLREADNAESKRLAKETVGSQKKEIAKLIAWVEKNASREIRAEAKQNSKK